jgi:nicotinamidase-related amidase
MIASMAKAAIIIVDLQTGMFDGALEPPIHESGAIAVRARALMAWARQNKWPIAFIRHDGPEGDPLAPGEPGWPVWPKLGQAEDEPTFSKNVADAFSNPALARWVANQGANEVVLLGAQTDHCIAGTVKGAMKAGLKVTVVSDAHSTLDTPQESAPKIIARHNAEFAKAGATLATTRSLIGG